MLNHYTMTNEGDKVPFIISHQEEIPFGFPNAGLYRHLQFTNDGTHCTNCGLFTNKVHEYHSKEVISGSHKDTPIRDCFNHRRYVCEPCNCTFMEPLPWLQPYQRITEIGREAFFFCTPQPIVLLK